MLIMTDDQGWGDFGFHGNTKIQTPNLDRLARESVEFTQFQVSSVCAPTRASLLTGRYHLRTGVHGVTGGRETIRPEEVTLARTLQDAGYRTGLFGKWHLGENYPSVPHAMGFDEFIGFRQGHMNRYFDPLLEDRGQTARPKGFITDILTDEAIRFVSESGADPFFVYLAYNAPHAPYQLPAGLFEKYRAANLPPEAAAVYGMVENIDGNIGRLLATLAERKIDQQTAVLFLTDNGPQTDRFNGAMRGRKASVYQGGLRTPLLVRWPGRLTGGRRVDRPAAHIDVLPTVLDLCGVKPPSNVELDGRSLKPLLDNPRAEWPERSLYAHYEAPAAPGSLYPGSVRTGRWKMVNGSELYDLEADPAESVNLAATQPEQLKRLVTEYESWFRGVTTERSFRVPPIPVGHPQENPARLYAPQAALRDGARFRHQAGFAHDWIVGLGEAQWTIDAAAAGQYEIGLRCLSPGVPVDVEIGEQKINFDLAAARSLEPIALPDRVARREAAEMPWEIQILGVVRLKAGPQTVTVRGNEVQLKEVLLRRLN